MPSACTFMQRYQNIVKSVSRQWWPCCATRRLYLVLDPPQKPTSLLPRLVNRNPPPYHLNRVEDNAVVHANRRHVAMHEKRRHGAGMLRYFVKVILQFPPISSVCACISKYVSLVVLCPSTLPRSHITKLERPPFPCPIPSSKQLSQVVVVSCRRVSPETKKNVDDHDDCCSKRNVPSPAPFSNRTQQFGNTTM